MSIEKCSVLLPWPEKKLEFDHVPACGNAELSWLRFLRDCINANVALARQCFNTIKSFFG